jgi:hypothetical protein
MYPKVHWFNFPPKKDPIFFMAINSFGISERCSILRFPRASDRNFWLLTDPGAGVGERIHDGFTSTVAWLKKSGYLLKGIQLVFFPKVCGGATASSSVP